MCHAVVPRKPYYDDPDKEEEPQVRARDTELRIELEQL